jgi:hypothetical protein
MPTMQDDDRPLELLELWEEFYNQLCLNRIEKNQKPDVDVEELEVCVVSPCDPA